MTNRDTTENITFPQFCWRVVKIGTSHRWEDIMVRSGVTADLWTKIIILSPCSTNKIHQGSWLKSCKLQVISFSTMIHAVYQVQITLPCSVKTFKINSEKFPVIPYDAWFLFRAVLTLEQAELLCGSVYEEYHEKLKPRTRTRFEQRRQSLQVTITHTANQQLTLSNRLVILVSCPPQQMSNFHHNIGMLHLKSTILTTRFQPNMNF